jgi:glycogen debranching enzyme, archaeal type, putative
MVAAADHLVSDRTSGAQVLVLPWHAGEDPERLLALEWLVTNGLGGYASGTVRGIATRCYHGVFIPNLPSPHGRTVMVPRVDEELEIGTQTIRLNGAEFADGRIEGDIVQFLRQFRWEWGTPVWEFEVDGRRFEKRIAMPYGQNTVYVEHRLLGDGPARLTLRPFVTLRMHDAELGVPSEWPFTLTITRRRYEVHAFEGAPGLRLCLRPPCGVFVVDARVSQGVFYRVDRDRGYNHVEDLFSPGYFLAEIRADQPIAFVASTERWELLEFDAASIFEAAWQRLKHLLALAPAFARTGFAAQLVLAADQFIILPGSRLEENALARAGGTEARTVVAGYHWFTDWGRDTMISLEGLTLCTGRFDEARDVLRAFCRYIKDGLLPNHFPEGQRSAIYNTVDATFWYFHALDRYYQATGDRETLELLFPILRSVIEHHLRGTHFGIHVDRSDSLVAAGAEGYALTWMDAKVEEWVVTPWRGKPVEIQALWYNALRLMATWAEELGESSNLYREQAQRACASFNRRFWFEASGYLYDLIDGEHGDDPSLRPNQIFSLSLRFPILNDRRWRPVVDTVADKLLTPVGLRSLASSHKDYKPTYFGDLRARDAAYHQGTVWAWLIGHFLDAWIKVYGDKARARTMLEGFEAHLWEAGIGTISEIFDAEPPYTPRACIAQAWSVAEVLRALQALE